MRITIESTDKVIMLLTDQGEVPARVWQGTTDSGIPVQCYVTRIAPEIPKTAPSIDAVTAQFERELKSCATPRPTVEAIPLRMII